MATKTVKKAIAKKTTAKNTTVKNASQDNVSKIKTTAQNVGNQVKTTAEVVLEDVKKNTEKLRGAAKGMDMTGSINKIQKTVVDVNKEVLTAATYIAEDLIENGKQFTNVAIKTVKDSIVKIDLAEGMERMAATAKTVNEFGLKTTDTMLNTALENGEKWQNVAGKAVKGGLQLAEKQQEMVFTTLETVKGQLVNSAKRFRGLFSQN